MSRESLRKRYEFEVSARARQLRLGLGLGDDETIETAIVLGTGWADAFPLEVEKSVPMHELGWPFNLIEPPEPQEDDQESKGHARRYEIGTVNGHRIIVLRGRVHMNEATFEPMIKLAVRAQVEVLLRLGVKNLILTTGTGSLVESIRPGSVVLIDGWVSAWAEQMPLFPFEFVNPEDTIDQELMVKLLDLEDGNLPIREFGSHVFWLGPHFEGRKNDKELMQASGGLCVSMSVKPEACIAGLERYTKQGVRVIPMAFVCNGPFEVMSHKHHRAVAMAAAPKLSALLQRTVELVHS